MSSATGSCFAWSKLGRRIARLGSSSVVTRVFFTAMTVFTKASASNVKGAPRRRKASSGSAEAARTDLGRWKPSCKSHQYKSSGRLGFEVEQHTIGTTSSPATFWRFRVANKVLDMVDLPDPGTPAKAMRMRRPVLRGHSFCRAKIRSHNVLTVCSSSMVYVVTVMMVCIEKLGWIRRKLGTIYYRMLDTTYF